MGADGLAGFGLVRPLGGVVPGTGWTTVIPATCRTVVLTVTGGAVTWGVADG
jgi:hypothetical protein